MYQLWNLIKLFHGPSRQQCSRSPAACRQVCWCKLTIGVHWSIIHPDKPFSAEVNTVASLVIYFVFINSHSNHISRREKQPIFFTWTPTKMQQYLIPDAVDFTPEWFKGEQLHMFMTNDIQFLFIFWMLPWQHDREDIAVVTRLIFMG